VQGVFDAANLTQRLVGPFRKTVHVHVVCVSRRATLSTLTPVTACSNLGRIEMQLIGQSLRLASLNSTLIGIWKVPPSFGAERKELGPLPGSQTLRTGLGTLDAVCTLHIDGSDPIGRSLYVNGPGPRPLPM